MTQKRLKEIQAETELDYEPVNMRKPNIWMNQVKNSKTEYVGSSVAILSFILFFLWIFGVILILMLA